MTPTPKHGKDICIVRRGSEEIIIPYLKQLVKIETICPCCGKKEKSEQVFRFIEWQIKYKHRRLIDLNKIKQQINEILNTQTHICMNCCARLTGQ